MGGVQTKIFDERAEVNIQRMKDFQQSRKEEEEAKERLKKRALRKERLRVKRNTSSLESHISKQARISEDPSSECDKEDDEDEEYEEDDNMSTPPTPKQRGKEH